MTDHAPVGLVVLGHGGLARRMSSMLDDALDGGGYKLIGFLDSHRTGTDVELLGNDELLAGLDASYLVGVADTGIRKRLCEYADGLGKTSPTLISRHARIERAASFGPGCVVFAGACVEAHATLERNVLVNVNAVIGHESTIGAHSVVGPLTVVGGNAELGEQVSLGANSVVLPGRSVGDRTVVGAGAVVVRDVGPDAVVTGVPGVARVRAGTADR